MQLPEFELNLFGDIVHTQQILSLFLSVLLGGMIGFEREWNGKPAGLRTNIIICLGAAAFTMIADRYTNFSGDGSRIIQGVVTGVGFLGAGALIQAGSGVHGLTTAASIWLVTSVGIACGAGMFSIAIPVTIMTVIVLFGLQPISRWIRKKTNNNEFDIKRKEDFNE